MKSMSRVSTVQTLTHFASRPWRVSFSPTGFTSSKNQRIRGLGGVEDAVEFIRKYFFACEWPAAYDFVEFTLRQGPPNLADDFRYVCNTVLEMENSGYRFVDDSLVEITAPEEIESIEAATASPYTTVNVHLGTALRHLSDRKHPDYRNSIKEAISAVEALAKLISSDSKTLGPALTTLRRSGALHPALEKAFSSLYGYTSDADGIRHALLDNTEPSFTDAKFMLVACSAFVNYLIGKAADGRIKIGGA